jgi:hypothetical protein
MTEQQKQSASEWYGSCEFNELLEIKQRLDYAIQERLADDLELVARYKKFCVENSITY